MKCAGLTHPGRKRSNNEDAFALEPGLSAAILADGMGGENCGEVASALTVETTVAYLRAPENGLTLEEKAKEAIRSANACVLEASRGRNGCQGMGSTIVLALWHGPELVIANAGDSRAYLLRDGTLTQLSYDQSFANELRTKLGFSEERLRAMPNRNVLTMAVGIYDQILVRTHVQQLAAGDVVLLCSDGLHGPVDEGTITRILMEAGTLEEKAEKLVGCANERGGPDNVTTVLMEYPGG